MRKRKLTHTYRTRSTARALSRVHPCFPPSVHGEAEVVVPARLPQLREVGVAVAQHAVHRGVALLDGEPRRVDELARRGANLSSLDQRARATRQIEDLTLRDAWILGLWQALALIPGTSRSGITITGALNAGFNRKEAARIAMLMSIPTIIASGALTSLDLIGGTVPLRDTAIVVAFSFAAALMALSLMMRLLSRLTYTPYVIYRIGLGLTLLTIGYSGSLGF